MLALILCLMIPLMLIVSAAVTQNSGSIWQVKIQGFDPRDLLRGHYLMFRYDWNIKKDASPCTGEATCCLCVTASEGSGNINPQARPILCNSPERRTCDAVVGSGPDGFWESSYEYFIPEDRAMDLQSMLWDPHHEFRIEVSIPRRGGKPAIRGLYIDGRPMADVLRGLPPPGVAGTVPAQPGN